MFKTSRGFRHAVLLGFLALGAVPASAQVAGGASGEPIVVTGQSAPTREETMETVRRMARPVDGQLARFHDPVCPIVTGIGAPYAAKVVERIRRTAEAIGADVGREGCEANLSVIVVDDSRDFVRELARRYPDVVEGLSKTELEKLVDAPGAARAWSTTFTTNSAGTPTSRPEAGQDYGTIRVYEASNFDPSVQQVVRQAWVVIDTQATLGKSLTQIADYAAMRALAMVRPSELDGSEDTILALFEPGGDVPAALTRFDRAYLTGLYRVPPRRWARSQGRYVADAILRDAEKATP